jgi:hypothetical protein
MREIVHIQAGQCGNQVGAKVKISMSEFYTKMRFQESNAVISFSFGKIFLKNMAWIFKEHTKEPTQKVNWIVSACITMRLLVSDNFYQEF